METLRYIIIAAATVFFFSFRRLFSFSNLPLLRIVPSMLFNFPKVYDRISEVLEKKGTLILRQVGYRGGDMVLTTNPANVHYVTSTNFNNYPKGPEWKKRFDIFGNSIFNADFEDWMNQRKTVRSFFSHQLFQRYLAKILSDAVERELVPLLDHASQQCMLLDLQAVFRRHVSFFSLSISAGRKPQPVTLTNGVTGSYKTKASIFELPKDVFAEAIDAACEAILVRHIMPERLWKLQRWLGLGKEKGYEEAWATVDRIIESWMSMKKEEVSNGTSIPMEEYEDFCALRLYLKRHEIVGPIEVTNQYMRDMIMGLILAAQDTTTITLSWFFWLLSKHPHVEAKVLEELQEVMPAKGAQQLGLEDLSRMTYLHAALSETLRLYPPVPFQNRTATEADTLPSGHKIKAGTNVVMPMYAMGRMTAIWGPDCYEYKPERWITKEGGIKHEPAHKFFVFNAGPRICPGKDLAFIIAKTFAATIIKNYRVEVLKDQAVIPKSSLVYQMKYGLKARISKRSVC